MAFCVSIFSSWAISHSGLHQFILECWTAFTHLEQTFFFYVFITIIFSLGTSSGASCRFWCAVCWVLFSSICKISYETSSLTHMLFRCVCVLISKCLEIFLLFFCCWNIQMVPDLRWFNLQFFFFLSSQWCESEAVMGSRWNALSTSSWTYLEYNGHNLFVSWGASVVWFRYDQRTYSLLL